LKPTSYSCALACAMALLARSSVASAQTTSQEAPNEKPSSHTDDSVHVGVLGGVGFPRPLAVEGVIAVDRLVLFGAEYSALPEVNVAGVQTSIWALAGDVSVFPMRNGFFIGLRAGRQHLGEQGSLTVSGAGTLTATQTTDTTFVNPRIGFLWTWKPFALGIDAGVQIPVSVATTSTLPSSVTPPSTVTDVNRALGQQALPTVDLLRIGVVL
jgi:hypothetical protein